MAMAEFLRTIPLACCKLYISNIQKAGALGMIEKAARGHRLAPLLHVFEDKEYNRVGYTLSGALTHLNPCLLNQKSLSAILGSFPLSPTPLSTAVMATVKAALSNIDFQQHSGSHPRLGVVDHICFHPLGSASLEQVALMARAVAEEISSSFEVPTYLYGSAHQEGRPLDSTRRALGYFQCDSEGKWVGSSERPIHLQPDFGPINASPKAGRIVLGACPWVMNFNVPILSKNLTLCRQIARGVSQRGGGLAGVQAMALLHGDGIEIACNLLNVKATSSEMVQHQVERLAQQSNLEARQGYLTGYSEAEILDLTLSILFG